MLYREDGKIVFSTPRSPIVIIKLSALIIIANATIASFVMGVGGEIVHSTYDRTHIAIIPSGTTIAIIALIYLLGMLTHEMGHVLMFRVYGLGWHILVIGQTMAVLPHRRPDTQQTILTSISGPLIQASIGALLIAASPAWSPLQLAGVLLIIEGLANLLIPLGPSSDAGQLYRAAGTLIARALQNSTKGSS